MPNKRKSDYIPHISPEMAQGCHISGCHDAGVYKAPKSRQDLYDYQWFCLEHIREHNKKWDYFAGLEADEIESFVKDAVYGHRPTWNRESYIKSQPAKLHEALYQFLYNTAKKSPVSSAPLSSKLRKALARLDIEYPYTIRELKSQYRIMVKKYHPDLNKGDKKSEEIFKHITAAYNYLSEQLKVV